MYLQNFYTYKFFLILHLKLQYFLFLLFTFYLIILLFNIFSFIKNQNSNVKKKMFNDIP